MISKFNYNKFKTNLVDHKNAKFQKYIKERNEKLLERCFNIKMEKSVVEEKDNFKQMHEKNNEISEEENNKEALQQTFKNISLTTTNSGVIVSQQSLSKLVNKSEGSEKPSENISPANNMQSSRRNRVLESPSKQCSAPVQFSSKKNHSINSKTLKTISSKHSTSSPEWKSPFNSFVTKGTHTRLQRRQQSSEFSYDLSRDELKFAGPFCSPMRPAPATERQMLKNGQRKEYLMQRYEHSPVFKYNYPEATSWRIGWLQQKQ